MFFFSVNQQNKNKCFKILNQNRIVKINFRFKTVCLFKKNVVFILTMFYSSECYLFEWKNRDKIVKLQNLVTKLKLIYKYKNS